MEIPVEVEELTAEWLTEVLQPHAPGSVVEAVEIVDRSSGTTGRARLLLRSSDERLPGSVFVKLPPFTPERRTMVDMTGMGVSEARFYRELAGSVPVRTPGVWHAAHSPEGGYVMVLEDLTVIGARQPTQDEDDAAEFAEQVMDAFAALHATFQGDPRFSPGGEFAWVDEHTMRYGPGPGLDIIRMGVASFGDEMPPVFHEMVDIYLTRTSELSDLLFSGPATLIHGDSHIGNMLRDDDGPILLDWAVVGWGPGLRDVAYFVGNSVPEEVRRQHEQGLVRRYVEALRGHGVEMPFEEAWDTYRLQLVTGWISAASTASLGDALQPLEIGMRATHRSNRALDELDVLALLRERLG